MGNEALPKSFGGSNQPPRLSPQQEELCVRLDDFWKAIGYSHSTKPSDMFRGATHLIHNEQKTINPDWMSQAAHSLREILYPFWKGEDKKREYLKRHGSTGDEEKLTKDISDYFGFVTSVAHHQLEQARNNPIFGSSKPAEITTEIFAHSITRFESILFKALRRQIDAHKEIDDILAQEP